MFASRVNQENAIHEQQTAAAAKPLNQGVKGLAPKTPGNKAPKSPFKVSLNDENAALPAVKTGGKGKQDGLFGEGKSTKVDRTAFLTPAGPRNRAPLGNKTTNAKGLAFQTPAPPTQEKPSAKQSSPRMRRAKVKIHGAVTAAVESEDDLPDIEYMPPREVPLPDYPDAWPHDRTYPQFEGKNLTRGWFSEFANLKGDDDDSEFSDFEGKMKQAEEQQKAEMKQRSSKPSAVKTKTMQKAARDPLTRTAPQTLTAKSAASALSHPTRPSFTPSFAAPTASTKSRMPAALTSKKPGADMQLGAGNARYGAARVASNSTLGYSKGRAVSSSTRSPGLTSTQKPAPFRDAQQNSPAKTSLEELFARTGGLDLDCDDDDLGGGVLLDADDDEDEMLANFQLQPFEP